MFNLAIIQSYNDSPDSYGAVREFAKFLRIQPIGFESFITDLKGDKCAIHMPVYLDDTGYGCGDFPIGKHPSIRALYDKTPRSYCHADEGAKVIDREFAANAAKLSDDFLATALRRTKRFKSRYMAGSAVDWETYGRGYCYLQLLHLNVRHRVARILGPFPLLSDVLRFVLLAGNWGDVGYCYEHLPNDTLHVQSCDWNYDTSLRGLINSSRDVCNLRVGGVTSSAIVKSLGYGDLAVVAGYDKMMAALDDIRNFIATVPVERVNAMRAWISVHGIAQSDDILACLLIATSALAALNVAGVGDIARKVRLWQVLGDLVCKHFAILHVMASDGTVEDYSILVGKGHQCNKSMSSAIVKSDLYPLCSADGLSLESKAWADILEGVIGVIAMTQPAATLKHCLIHFGLIPDKSDNVLTLFPANWTLPSLNSSDWRKAAEMIIKGKL